MTEQVEDGVMAGEEGAFETVEVVEEQKEEKKEDDTKTTLERLYVQTQERMAKMEERKPEPIDFTKLADAIVQAKSRGEGEKEDGYSRMKKKADEKIIEDPMGVMTEFANFYIGPAQEILVKSQIEMARDLVALRLPEAERGIFEKYTDEIDVIVKKRPLAELARDPKSAYREALDAVKAVHIEDIVQQRLQEERAKRPQGVQIERSNPSAPPAEGSKIRITRQQEMAIKQEMERNNVPMSRFQTVVEIMKEEGRI